MGPTEGFLKLRPTAFKGVVYLRGFKKSNFFFLLISNLDTIRNMPYEGFIRKHAGSNTTDLIIYL